MNGKTNIREVMAMGMKTAEANKFFSSLSKREASSLLKDADDMLSRMAEGAGVGTIKLIRMRNRLAREVMRK